MARAYSVKNVYDAKFKTLPFTDEWLDAIGEPELTGSMIILGPPKNGKTSFALQFAKYLTRFSRVAYNSVEEGLSRTMQMALSRVNMIEAGTRFVLLEKEGFDELIVRLDRHKSPNIVFIDSIQFMELSFDQYKTLKSRYPDKLIVYLSHVEGGKPDGAVAKRIWRDANVVLRVEGFKMFPVGRYGGGAPIIISEQKAAEYWGLEAMAHL